MKEEKKILFISNGYGEDNIAANVASELRKQNPQCKIGGFPTVGHGKFYNELNIHLAGRGIELPSEGFVRSIKDFVNDVRDGFFAKTLRMGLEIKKASKSYDFLIATGDPYLLLFSTFFTNFKRKNKIFIGTLQSEWYDSKKPFKLHYSFIERLWLRWYSSLIIVRDTKTSEYLQSRGLMYAKSYGNPMMDCFEIQDSNIFPKDCTVIGILPGSKKEAYDNFGTIIETVKRLVKINDQSKNYLFPVAFSPNLDIDRLVERYGLSEVSKHHGKKYLGVYNIKNSEIELTISNRIFGNIISESKAVIGLSGTGNEQACGMGKPVFTFWGNGPQITKKFLLAQKRLLGESLFVLPPDPIKIAKKIHDVLKDDALLVEIEKNGEKRMGGRGSIKLIAEEIGRFIDRNTCKQPRNIDNYVF